MIDKIENNEIHNSNEKEINISRENTIKSNSLLIKSVDEGDIDIIDFIKNKLLISIIFTNKNIVQQVPNKSILKIIRMLIEHNDNNSDENLENYITQYITFTIFEDNSYKVELTGNSIGILDSKFTKLLEQNKIYKINIATTNENEMKKESLNDNNNKISISSKSLEKICKYLEKTIYDIYNYINILIIYNNEKDMDKEIIKKKLIDKYDKVGQKIYFMGSKQFETECIIPPKHKKSHIYRLNILFNNVLGKIENTNNSFDDNGDIFEKKNRRSEENIKSEININYNSIHNINENKINEDLEKNGCQKEFCPACIIF
jgi:hypothetical protein